MPILRPSNGFPVIIHPNITVSIVPITRHVNALIKCRLLESTTDDFNQNCS